MIRFLSLGRSKNGGRFAPAPPIGQEEIAARTPGPDNLPPFPPGLCPPTLDPPEGVAFMSGDEGMVLFPKWVALSGLPLHLLEKGKSPAPWLLLRTIIDVDLELNPLAPGLVEIPLGAMAERAGLDVPRLDKALKVLRKELLVRAFVPEHEEETALFQILQPLPTPLSLDEILNRHPELGAHGAWPPRYATPAIVEGEADPRQARLAKIQRVAELYLDIFSMKVNNLILEELQLIATRYELPLIEKAFQRARQAESRSLGWIVADIRKEMKLAAKAEELRAEAAKSSL